MSNAKDFNGDDAHEILHKLMKCERRKTICDNQCERCDYRTDTDELIALAEYAIHGGDISKKVDDARKALSATESSLDDVAIQLDSLTDAITALCRAKETL